MEPDTIYTAPAAVSSPTGTIPEASGDRATLRVMLSWLGHVQLPNGRSPTPYDRLVWAALFAHCDVQTQAAFPSLPHIAGLCAISLRCVRSAVRKLEALGLVRSERRSGRSTVYRLTLPPTSAPARRAAPAPARLTSPPTIRRHPRPAPSAQRTPAPGAATPARDAGLPRHGVPPEELRVRTEIKNSSRAPAQTPARDAAPRPEAPPAGTTLAAADCPRAAASEPACAASTAPAEPETTSQRTETPPSPQARPARHASARAASLVHAVSRALGMPDDPGTGCRPAVLETPRHDAPPPPLEHPGTTHPPDPSPAPVRPRPPEPPPPTLASVMARVALLNGGRR